MIIAIDADGICCNLLEAILLRYNRDYNDNRTIAHFTHWEMARCVKPECGEKIYNYFHEPDLYEAMQPIPGALEGVQQIRAWGHEVIFVTGCTWGMTDQKARWFIRNGFLPDSKTMLPHAFIAATNKLMVDAHVLIEDRGETVRDWVNLKRRTAVLLEYPHNKFLLDEMPSAFWSHCLRANSWPQIIALLARKFQIQ